MKEDEIFFNRVARKKSVTEKRLLKLVRSMRLDNEDKFKYCLI